MKPICVPCQRFYRMKQAGFYFTEGMPVGPGLPPAGTEAPEKWKPYKVWAGDLWVCQGCGSEIISGFGREPIAIQHEEDFTEHRLAIGADQFQVNDC